MGGNGIQIQVEKMERSTLGRARHGKKNGSEWRGVRVSFGSEADEPLKARKEWHERVRETVENNPLAGRRRGAPRQGSYRW